MAEPSGAFKSSERQTSQVPRRSSGDEELRGGGERRLLLPLLRPPLANANKTTRAASSSQWLHPRSFTRSSSRREINPSSSAPPPHQPTQAHSQALLSAHLVVSLLLLLQEGTRMLSVTPRWPPGPIRPDGPKHSTIFGGRGRRHWRMAAASLCLHGRRRGATRWATAAAARASWLPRCQRTAPLWPAVAPDIGLLRARMERERPPPGSLAGEASLGFACKELRVMQVGGSQTGTSPLLGVVGQKCNHGRRHGHLLALAARLSLTHSLTSLSVFLGSSVARLFPLQQCNNFYIYCTPAKL